MSLIKEVLNCCEPELFDYYECSEAFARKIILNQEFDRILVVERTADLANRAKSWAREHGIPNCYYNRNDYKGVDFTSPGSNMSRGQRAYNCIILFNSDDYSNNFREFEMAVVGMSYKWCVAYGQSFLYLKVV